MDLKELEQAQEELFKKAAEYSESQKVQDAGEINFYSENKEAISVVGIMVLVMVLGIVADYFGFIKYLYLLISLVATFGILRLFNVLINAAKVDREIAQMYSRIHKLQTLAHRDQMKHLKDIKDLITYYIAMKKKSP